MKTVIPFSGEGKRMDSTSGSVGLHRIPGEPVAFDEHFIDWVNRLPAVAGRRTRPERRLELRAWHGLPPHPPAGKTPGLARQILERQLEGLEPPGEAFGTHEAIGRRNGIGYGRGAGRRVSYGKKWMRGGLRVNFLRCWRSSAKFFRVSKSWKEGGRFPPPFPMGPTGMGRGKAPASPQGRAPR